MSTKFRLIAFNAAMIAALDAGRKTQTRRKIEIWPPLGYERLQSQGVGHSFAVGGQDYHCPYGGPGTVLVVKEPWAVVSALDDKKPADISPFSDWGLLRQWPREVAYQCFGEGAVGKARVARFMPYWAGRRYLVLEKVRYEPMSWISAEDAIAEGIECLSTNPEGVSFWRGYEGGGCSTNPKLAFYDLWDSVHGTGSWAVPTMVWALSFRSVVAGSEEWQGLRAELLEQAAERFERTHKGRGALS